MPIKFKIQNSKFKKMKIIPAIDIINGKCVRLTKGDYSQQKTYNEHPLEVARQFEDAGLSYLHLVDLDGAKNGKITNYKVLETLASKTTLQIDFGGGLKTDADLKIAFESGARQVTGGSIAVKNPELFENWITQYGGEKIILGSDVIDGKIATNAWQSSSEKNVLEFIADYLSKGILYTICTDVSKDGMLQGPSTELYRSILEHTPEIKLIASGGIATLSDVITMQEIGCEGVIIGKAIYENKISLKELSQLVC